MKEFNKFNDLAEDLKHVKRTQTARMSSWAIINSRIKKKKINILPAIATCVTTAIVALFLLFTLNDYNPTYQNASQDIPIIEVSDRMFTIDYTVENMDRGQYEYMSVITKHKVVINPDVSDFKRGDVVYYNTPEYITGIQGIENKYFSLREHLGINVKEKQISRIVGLAGERIQIRKGQVYINDKKLETFYSSPTVRGMNKTEYLKTVDHNNSTLTKDDFEENMDTMLIPVDSVFVLGDQWSRSIDSRLFGPFSLSNIQGKVVGYEEKH